ncbi:MAG TPA: hypothetical protein VNX46_15680 [Candidatus Acidoferrum sp.]|nr:hypothetical protein [Candidatus Acidoferrum sp.]
MLPEACPFAKPSTQRDSTSSAVPVGSVSAGWIIRFIFRSINLVLFSWWVNRLFDRWIRNGFAADIRGAIPALFDLHGGKVIRDPKPETNDGGMDYVCISTPTLLFKFRRWHRENYGVEVAPPFAAKESFELLDILNALDTTVVPDRNFMNLMDTSWRYWGELLEPRFKLLEHAFSSEHFQETKKHIIGMPRSW